MKKTIKNLLIWLNTPRCIDIPVFQNSPDSQLYDDLNKRVKNLEQKKQEFIEKAADWYTSQVLYFTGLLPTRQEALQHGETLFQLSKQHGNIDDMNEIVHRNEVF